MTDNLAPCPVCSAPGEATPVGQIRCTNAACEFAIVSWMPDTWNRLARAAALLRACERLDAAALEWDGEFNAGSILLDERFIISVIILGEVQYGPLADALIALAAGVEEVGDETMA